MPGTRYVFNKCQFFNLWDKATLQPIRWGRLILACYYRMRMWKFHNQCNNRHVIIMIKTIVIMADIYWAFPLCEAVGIHILNDTATLVSGERVIPLFIPFQRSTGTQKKHSNCLTGNSPSFGMLTKTQAQKQAMPTTGQKCREQGDEPRSTAGCCSRPAHRPSLVHVDRLSIPTPRHAHKCTTVMWHSISKHIKLQSFFFKLFFGTDHVVW